MSHAHPVSTRAGDSVAGLICAVIGILALVGVLGFGLFSSDDASAGSAPPVNGPSLHVGSGAVSGGSGASGGSGGSGGSDSSGGSDGGHQVNGDQLKADFPLPPGAHHVGLAGDSELLTSYEVASTLAEVTSFYEKQLDALGVTLVHSGDLHVGGKIAGHSWTLQTRVDGQYVGNLTVDAKHFEVPAGQIVIQVGFL